MYKLLFDWLWLIENRNIDKLNNPSDVYQNWRIPFGKKLNSINGILCLIFCPAQICLCLLKQNSKKWCSWNKMLSTWTYFFEHRCHQAIFSIKHYYVYKSKVVSEDVNISSISSYYLFLIDHFVIELCPDML